MTRPQRQKAQDMKALRERIRRFADRPCALSEKHVEALLEQLCGDLGYCLTPDDHDALVADPPTNPQTFAERVMELEGVDGGWSDLGAFLPVLERALRTFEGVSAADEEPEPDLD